MSKHKHRDKRMTNRQAEISQAIIEKFVATGSISEAINSVFGDPNAYENIAGYVYDLLIIQAQTK